MTFSIRDTITSRQGENYALHEKHVNRTLVKVLRTIGFDKVYTRAEGAYLYDADGADYLDFLSGYGVFGVGRSHPVVKKALADVLDMDLANMVQMDCALLSGLLAEELTKRTGPGLDTVFFANSGTEAVEGALKFARAATGRPRLLSLDRAYHGLSFGSLSVTNIPNFQEGFGPLLPGTLSIPYNDIETLERELRKGDVAAFIAEPIQGKGVNIPAEDFLPQAQQLCRKYGSLFICDEVQTGLGRTGKMFGFQHWNLEPDIITIAKTLSGGYAPVAAIVTRRTIEQKVFSRLDRCVVHSTSFGRNNLGMAAGLATLSIIDDENLIANAERMGEKIRAGVQALIPKHELLKEVRGRGLMIAIEFHQPKSLKLKMAWKAIHAVDRGLFAQMIVTPMLQKHRILTQVAGHHMDVLKILPPLIITEREVDRFVSALDSVLEDATRFPGPLWDFGTNLVKQAIKSR